MLKKFEQSHRLQELLNRLKTKIDLNKLSYAKETIFNFYEDDYIIYYSAIWVNLLRDIYC